MKLKLLRTVPFCCAGQPALDRPAVTNLSTVAILPVSDDVPLANFTLELQCCLNALGENKGTVEFVASCDSTWKSFDSFLMFCFPGETLRLDSHIMQNRLGAAVFDT